MKRPTPWLLLTALLAAPTFAGEAQKVRLPAVQVGEPPAAVKYEPAQLVAMLTLYRGGREMPRPGVVRSSDAPLVLIFEDGRVVWSEDLVEGRGPWRSGKVDRAAAAALASQVDALAAGSQEALTEERVGPDGTFATLYLRRAGSPPVLMKSWHPRDPQSKVVATSRGLVAREGRDPEALLAADTADYRRFRKVWAELEEALMALQRTAKQPQQVSAKFTWGWTDAPTSPH